MTGYCLSLNYDDKQTALSQSHIGHRIHANKSATKQLAKVIPTIFFRSTKEDPDGEVAPIDLFAEHQVLRSG